jgi:trigger factor
MEREKLNITREELPGRQVALTIELDPETVSGALDRAYRQMVNQVNVPGFRRGKAPRYILESYLGRDTLTERAVRNILPQTVEDALKGEDIEAMDVGDVEIVNLDPVQVRVVVIQPPRIEIGDYSGLRVEREPIEITDEEVDKVLLEMRREGAPWEEPAEPRPIQEGDMVYLNLEGFTSQGELEEAKRENFPTIVGMARAGVPMPVSNALVGMSVGEEKDVTDALPDDYPNEALRGMDVSYHVTAISMKEQKLAELDDEFAKKVSEGAQETVEGLREFVLSSLRTRADEGARENQVNQAIEKLVEGSTVDVPDKMVDEELDEMLKRIETRLKQQRLTLRQYFTYNGSSDAEWREQHREDAHNRVIRTLVLQEFARREGIEVDDTDIDNEVERMLGRFEGEERQQAEAVLGHQEARHDLEHRIYENKLVDRLVGIAEGTIEAAPVPEMTASEEAAVEPEPEAGEADATALESAGGAAEVLGTGDVDLKSPYETGEASGGGTPEDAPRLQGQGG